ncbi:MAG: thermonuclease family protein [Pseudomonadota bacterium]
MPIRSFRASGRPIKAFAPRGQRRRRRPHTTIRVGSFRFYLVVAFATAGVILLQPADSDALHASTQMPVCGGSLWDDCVVDGDTIRLAGERIRLESFNTPELQGACPRERRMALQATRRLSEILSSQPFTIVLKGHDRYGRRLATISNSEGDIGATLIREGLAHAWHGRRESWCV